MLQFISSPSHPSPKDTNQKFLYTIVPIFIKTLPLCFDSIDANKFLQLSKSRRIMRLLLYSSGYASPVKRRASQGQSLGCGRNCPPADCPSPRMKDGHKTHYPSGRTIFCCATFITNVCRSSSSRIMRPLV